MCVHLAASGFALVFPFPTANRTVQAGGVAALLAVLCARICRLDCNSLRVRDPPRNRLLEGESHLRRALKAEGFHS